VDIAYWRVVAGWLAGYQTLLFHPTSLHGQGSTLAVHAYSRVKPWIAIHRARCFTAVLVY
jgi:hypothetical protein